MSYLKGGTVVDGNLYIEGELKVIGQSEVDGIKYAFLRNPNNLTNYILKVGNDGQIIDTSFKEEVDAGKSTITPKSTIGNIHIKTFPGYISIIDDSVPSNEEYKNELHGFSSNGVRVLYNSDYLPISEPQFWGYDVYDSYHLTGIRSGGTVNYTIPASDTVGLDLDVGESVVLSGDPQ